MPFLFFAAIALIGAAIHAHRERHKGAARTLEIFLVWWMVVAVGVAAIFGAMFHLTPLVAIGLYAAWQRSRRALAAALR